MPQFGINSGRSETGVRRVLANSAVSRGVPTLTTPLAVASRDSFDVSVKTTARCITSTDIGTDREFGATDVHSQRSVRRPQVIC